MDAQRFDAMIRSIDQRAPRQAVLRLLGGGLAALLTRPSGDDAEARKRKHKKGKHDRGNKKACPIGAKTCGTTCIPAAHCCGDADCGSGMACQDGTCTCHAGLIPCGATCVSGDQCCLDSTCGGDYVCDDGFCGCPEQHDEGCGARCCNSAAGEYCVVVAGEPVCQTSGCTTTDWCTDAHLYVCGPGCSCATSIDETSICTDFADISCRECASDADCTLELGSDAVCIPNGLYCADKCDASLSAFCVAPSCARSSARRSPGAPDGMLKGKRKSAR